MRDIPPADHAHEFVGGALALDFTNTLGGTHRAPDHEHLQAYADLVDFARQGTAISETEAKRLKNEAERHPVRAREVLRRARSLREAMWRAFEAKALRREMTRDDIASMNEEIASALAHARLVPEDAGFVRAWSDDSDLERPLWPIARSCADLLESREALGQIRECASETCEWLFLDRSRNHSRRWCAMNDCGGVAKVRRFRARRKMEQTPSARPQP